MTDITYNGKEVVKMEVHDLGMSIWFRFHFKNGNYEDTPYYKGEV
jgi:hypothetical protein